MKLEQEQGGVVRGERKVGQVVERQPQNFIMKDVSRYST